MMSATSGLNGQRKANVSSSSSSSPSRNVMIYTHHLPYGIRRDICNLLDADQSWRILGGQFIGLDVTQLTLIGQAYLRNGSPTEELLNKLDSANMRISEFCFYLKQMNHNRALEILQTFALANQREYSRMSTSGAPSTTTTTTTSNTLYTPTPSFGDLRPPQQVALMGPDNLESCLEQSLNGWLDGQQPVERHQQQQPFDIQEASKLNKREEQKCHKTAQSPLEDQKKPADDPGEEIVRMACANNRKRTSISDQEVVNQLRLIMQINYNELKLASNNFSDTNILGNGGFASVYRGYWKGTDVAIKRLRCNLMDQALNELTILNSYRIDNILPIYGISIDGPEACLVYQFMSNGSLEDRLSCKKDSRPLSWGQRALIGEGVAKGLYYLHTLRDKPLVHGDVKSANVLLDSQFVPKLGDFGLARQVFKGKNPLTELCTHCTVSSIHGTSVYLPPEYLRHKILSPAVDVYSYGIVLLEMATGRRAFDGKRLLIDLVEDETRSMSSMDQITVSLKDPRLSGPTTTTTTPTTTTNNNNGLEASQTDLRIWFELLIKLGVNCAHKIKKKRPDIGQVLSHFANFHENTSNLLAEDLRLVSNGNSNATTRTLTPDLSSLADNANANTNTNKNSRPYRQQVVGQQQAPAYQRNSSMMSFEEEQPEGNEAPDQQVAAMIPLLTELGLEVADTTPRVEQQQ